MAARTSSNVISVLLELSISFCDSSDFCNDGFFYWLAFSNNILLFIEQCRLDFFLFYKLDVYYRLAAEGGSSVLRPSSGGESVLGSAATEALPLRPTRPSYKVTIIWLRPAKWHFTRPLISVGCSENQRGWVFFFMTRFREYRISFNFNYYFVGCKVGT